MLMLPSIRRKPSRTGIEALGKICSLRQSPTNWSNTINEHMMYIGSDSLKFDPCVYTYSGIVVIHILTLYVDAVL